MPEQPQWGRVRFDKSPVIRLSRPDEGKARGSTERPEESSIEKARRTCSGDHCQDMDQWDDAMCDDWVLQMNAKRGIEQSVTMSKAGSIGRRRRGKQRRNNTLTSARWLMSFRILVEIWPKRLHTCSCLTRSRIKLHRINHQRKAAFQALVNTCLEALQCSGSDKV